MLGRLGIQNSPEPQQATDEVTAILRDIQKRLNSLASEIKAIKNTLEAIQGDEPDHSLSDIASALDRIEETMY